MAGDKMNNIHSVVPPHMVKHENCKGCKGCLGDAGPQYMDEDGVTKECPCSTCLVKGICEKTCEEFYEYNYFRCLYREGFRCLYREGKGMKEKRRGSMTYGQLTLKKR